MGTLEDTHGMGFNDQNFFEGNLRVLGSSIGSPGSLDVYVDIWQCFYFLSVELRG